MIPNYRDRFSPEIKAFCFLRTLLPICLTLLVLGLNMIAGCTTAPQLSPIETPEVATAISNANRMLYLNQYNEAGQAFLAIAQRLPSPYRQQQLLQAASAFYTADNIGQFETTIRQIDLPTADQATRIRVLWLQIDHQMAQERFALATNLLTRLEAETLSPDDREQLERTRLTISTATEDWLSALQARTALRPYLKEEQAQKDNLHAMWEQVAAIDFVEVALRMPPPPDEFGGWIELIYFLKYPRITPPQLENHLQLWRLRYPTHPALADLETWQHQFRSNTYEPPKQVALLLPLHGRLQHYAELLRDGFIAGYLAQPHADRPIVRIYDIGDDPANVIPVYHEAVANGADFVVGPLDKEAFELLITDDEIRTPMIGLNYLAPELTLPPAVFQFGLLPEDEAAEAARYAYAAGHRTALLFVPDTNLGKRHAQAFTQTFTALGGRIASELDYPATANDFSDSITRLLNINQSAARHHALVSALGMRLEYEPRRRDDADFIFVVGSSQKIRLIRPQLKFHHASQLPVFAPASVHTHATNPQLDSDLNGVLFVDTPWQLNNQASELRSELSVYWSERFNQLGNFFALGYDAAQLISEIPQLLNDPDYRHPGLTGKLSVSPTNAIKRQLDLGTFVGGTPRVVP